jgi:hypothetical protein
MFLCVKHNVVYVHVLNHKNSCVETKQNEMNRQIRKLFQILFEIVFAVRCVASYFQQSKGN